MEEKDSMREICIQQGYVPPTCTLDGMLIIGLVNKGEDPCSGCNRNRDICKGRRKSYDSYNIMDGIDFLFDKERREREERARELRKIEEQERKERQDKHLSITNLHRLMDVSFELHSGIQIIIKDLINEKGYYTRKIQSIEEAIEIIIHYTRRFQIQQIHIELNGGSGYIYENLKEIFKKENIDCDIVAFNYKPIREDTVLYSDELNTENNRAKFLYFHK